MSTLVLRNFSQLLLAFLRGSGTMDSVELIRSYEMLVVLSIFVFLVLVGVVVGPSVKTLG